MLSMEFSKHAQKRMQQRSIPRIAIDLLLEYGTCTFTKGEERYDFNKKGRKKVEKYFAPSKPPSELMNLYAIVDDNTLVTVGYRTKRFVWN